MTKQLLPEPEPGTVGAGVEDGALGDASSADEIRTSIAEYLRRSGIRPTEIKLLGLGSTTGGPMDNIVQNVWASLVILAASKFLAFVKGTRERKLKLEQNKQLRPCFIHLWDHREDRSNAIELLRLLPGLHTHLNQEFPNRNYTFSIWSSLAKPKLKQVHVKLENYDDLGLTTGAIMRRMTKLSDSPFVFVSLKDGPYYTRPYTLAAV
ncbi:hypothetical protein ACX800_10090 [Paenarthrobacter nitroguajacolicus]|uniref:hypothetical protein n=1 Tax=Paenarthrobacter nitroguajacolicus TaxID=211146 RepID=UPI003D2496B6